MKDEENMKSVFAFCLTAATLLTQSTYAASGDWKTLVSCDNETFLVQKACYTGPSQLGSPECYVSRMQVVVKNHDTQNYFADQKAYGDMDASGKMFGRFSTHYPEMLIPLDNAQRLGL
jgi:hypothetical protein